MSLMPFLQPLHLCPHLEATRSCNGPLHACATGRLLITSSSSLNASDSPIKPPAHAGIFERLDLFAHTKAIIARDRHMRLKMAHLQIVMRTMVAVQPNRDEYLRRWKEWEVRDRHVYGKASLASAHVSWLWRQRRHHHHYQFSHHHLDNFFTASITALPPASPSSLFSGVLNQDYSMPGNRSCLATSTSITTSIVIDFRGVEPSL